MCIRGGREALLLRGALLSSFRRTLGGSTHRTQHKFREKQETSEERSVKDAQFRRFSGQKILVLDTKALSLID
jgi:hypothetical protein